MKVEKTKKNAKLGNTLIVLKIFPKTYTPIITEKNNKTGPFILLE